MRNMICKTRSSVFFYLAFSSRPPHRRGLCCSLGKDSEEIVFQVFVHIKTGMQDNNATVQ
jgi:hypothetical protein